MDEQRRVDTVAEWYQSEQLDFDRRMIDYRFRSLQSWLIEGSCLELGPAEGTMTRRLVEACRTVTVVDGSNELLQSIPDRPNLYKVLALFEDFESAERFDNVVMEHILEHIENPRALLAQSRRWLAPGGRLLVGVPNGHSIHRLAAAKMGLLEDPCDLNDRDHKLGHRRVYTPDKLRMEIESCGYRIVHEGGAFFKPLSNAQIESTWTEDMMEGFYQLGVDFPQNASELLFVCEYSE